MNDQSPPVITERSELARFFRWLFSWRTIRRILIVLAWTATIIALLYGEENWRGRHAWNKYRQELEARGEQLDFKAFIPKAVPDEQNFAATPFIQSWFEKGSSQLWEDDFSRANAKVSSPKPKDRQAARRVVDLVAFQMAFDALRAGDANPHQTFESDKLDPESRAKAAPAVLQGLKACEPHLAELRLASRRPYSRYPVNYDLENPWGIVLSHLANVKGACSRLRIKACAELAAGQSENALADLKLLLYLSDSMKEERFLISYLVRIACLHLAAQPLWEGLAEHRWTDAQLLELQTRLQQYNFVADFKQPLGAEQAASILTVDLIKKNGLGLLVAIGEEGLPTRSDRRMADLGGLLVPSGWYDQEKMNYCRLYQEELGGAFDAAKKRFFPSQIESNVHELERQISGGRLGRGMGAVIHHRVIASLLLPSRVQVMLKSAIAQTVADQAALACALERYRLANGQFPEKLEALAPRFTPQLPNDVVTGEPYKYRPTPDAGFVLYSIGWDEKDDGGVPGRTLYDWKNGDWVWQSAPK